MMPSPAAGNAPGDGPGGFAPGYAPAPETAAHGGPPAHVQHPKHDAHMYGQLLQMAEKFANGEANIADVVNGISLLERTDSQFWRGLLAGGVATMLLASGPVRESLAGIFNRPGAGAVAANNDNRETVEENS
ncbi:MAG: hypothetical protein JW781_07340 [Deltaproteobacteria bacterium]|nr:hypothetical protein [Candidatus Anaeroferrophillacea bacterium]